jgi:hypothetical protein
MVKNTFKTGDRVVLAPIYYQQMGSNDRNDSASMFYGKVFTIIGIDSDKFLHLDQKISPTDTRSRYFADRFRKAPMHRIVPPGDDSI